MRLKEIVAVAAVAQVLMCNAQASNFVDSNSSSSEVRKSELFDTIAHEVIDQHKKLVNVGDSNQEKRSLGLWNSYFLYPLQSFWKLISGNKYSRDQEETKWNSHSLTPSQSFLKLIIGEDYKQGHDRENLEVLLRNKGIIDDEALTAFEKLLCFERQEYQKGNFVGYHGLKGEILFFYRYVSAINSLLTGRNIYNSSIGLRGNQLPFINAQTKKTYGSAEEVFKTLGSEKYHYGCELPTIFMFVNPFLTLEPSYGDTTASSLDFFFENCGGSFQEVKSLLMEMLILQGMSAEYAEQCYNEFHSLYEEFYGENNGGMLAISVPEDSWNTHINSVNKKGKEGALSRILTGIQEEAENMRPDRASYWKLGFPDGHAEMIESDPSLYDKFCEEENEKSKLFNLTDVFRIYLDPLKKFTTFSVWHHTPSAEEQQNLDNVFDNMIDRHVMLLLKLHSKPVENALVLSDSDTHLVDRFLSVYKEKTQENLEDEVNSETILPFLLERNLSDSFISVLNGKKLSPTLKLQEVFFRMTMEKHNYDVINWLKNVLEKGIQMRDFLTAERIQYVKDKVRGCSGYYTVEKFQYPRFSEFLLSIFSDEELKELGLPERHNLNG